MTGAVGPMTLTFSSTSAGPGSTSAALKFYIYSAEIAIPLRLMLLMLFQFSIRGPGVPINNNNYEQPIALFVIILAKNTFRKYHGCNLKLAPTHQQGRGLEDAICSCQLCIKWEVYLSTMVGQGEAMYFIFSYLLLN